MRKDRPRNVPASVKARLTDLARRQGEDFQLVLTRYVIERFLYRLSVSGHRDAFVLKGAMLFRLWSDEPHRATRDLDLLGTEDSSTDRLVATVRDVCTEVVPEDGIEFDPATVSAERMKEDQEYEGVRATCIARLGQARISLQIDIGFGDAVTPRPVLVEYPTILDFPAPSIAAYPRETVVAEKFQAMVALGIANSRMKDFFDLWTLARGFQFEGAALAGAIRATFLRRRTPVPADPPLALTEKFGNDAAKTKQWEAFIRRGNLGARGAKLEEVCDALEGFLMPPSRALAGGAAFDETWPPGGPWSAAESR